MPDRACSQRNGDTKRLGDCQHDPRSASVFRDGPGSRTARLKSAALWTSWLNDWIAYEVDVTRKAKKNATPAKQIPAKREYSRTRPETFGDSRPMSGEPEVQRQIRIREKPGFPGYYRVSWGAGRNAALDGWSRRDRTHAFLLEPVSGRHRPDLGISENL
jgi:hypothetical protein